MNQLKKGEAIIQDDEEKCFGNGLVGYLERDGAMSRSIKLVVAWVKPGLYVEAVEIRIAGRRKLVATYACPRVLEQHLRHLRTYLTAAAWGHLRRSFGAGKGRFTSVTLPR